MDVRMPDGTLISNVPDGITKSELMRRYNLSTGETQAPDATQIRVGIPGTDIGASFDVPQGVGEFVAGMGKGVTDRGRGIVQAGADLVGADEYATQLAQEQRQANELVQNAGGAFGAGEFAGDLASTALVPMGTSATVGKAMLKALPVGLGIAATETQTSDDPNIRQANRVQQGLLGMGFSAGTAGLLAKVGAVVNARRAKKLTDKQIYSELTKLADEYNIPLSLGDVKGPSWTNRLEVALERVPVLGTGSFRKKQQEAVRGAVNVYINKYGNLDDDISSRISLAVGDKLKKMKTIASKAYERFADDMGDGPIATPELNKAANKLLSTFRKEGTSSVVDRVKADLARFSDDMGLSFRKLRVDRDSVWKDLGNTGEKYLDKSGGASSYASYFFDDLKSALKKDIDNAARLAGRDISQKYSRIDRFYRKHVGMFKNGSWKTRFNALTDDGRSVSKALSIMRQKDSNTPRQLWGALTPDGRKAVRLAMLKDALNKATKSTDDLFSPSVFMRALDDYNIGMGKLSASQVAFRGPNKTELDGFMNLLQHVKRAGQYTENAPTGGNRLVDWLLPTGAGALLVYSPGTAVGVGGTAGLMTALFTTRMGRSALFKLSKARTPDKVAAVLGDVFKQMPKWAALTPRAFIEEEDASP